MSSRILRSASRRARAMLWYLRLRQTGRLRRLEDLRRSQWLTPEAAAAQQQQRLAALLAHAAVHVPYYREALLEAGVVTEAALDAARADGARPPGAPPRLPAIDLSRFGRVPLLDRETLRARFEDLKSDDLASRRWFDNYTGGSTSEPAHFVQDGVYREWVHVVKMLFDEWTGMRSGEPQVRVWGAYRDLRQNRYSLRVTAGRWLRNELWLNAMSLHPEQMRDYVRQINAFGPVQIMGYAQTLAAFARFVELEGLEIASPRAALTSATVLRPDMRETIERVLSAPVFDRYGAREVGDVACECERHAGLHVSNATHVVELLSPEGRPVAPGETGEVVVTLLTNAAMPLIRYRIGDLATWAGRDCACGRGWPLLEELKGRVSDLFVNESGGFVEGGWFGLPFYDDDAVAQFQVVQKTVHELELSVVPAPGRRDSLTSEWLENVAQQYRALIGPNLRLSLLIVDHIPTTPTGKLHSTISKIPSPFMQKPHVD